MSSAVSVLEDHQRARWAANNLLIGQIDVQTPRSNTGIATMAGRLGDDAGFRLHPCVAHGIIKAYDHTMIYIVGPGYGGAGRRQTGSSETSELDCSIGGHRCGRKRFFRQFSSPYGIHLAAETVGSIHERDVGARNEVHEERGPHALSRQR